MPARGREPAHVRFGARHISVAHPSLTSWSLALKGGTHESHCAAKQPRNTRIFIQKSCCINEKKCLYVMVKFGARAGILLNRTAPRSAIIDKKTEGISLQETDSQTSLNQSDAALLRTIVQAEPECVKRVDRSGRLLDMNLAGLAMIEADDLGSVVGVSLFKVVTTEHHTAFQSALDSVFDGNTVRTQMEIIGLRGGRRWVEQNAAPLFDPNDPTVVLELIAVTRDITEQKHYEARLMHAKLAAEAANVAKTAFLANMSHEIRTPMNGVLGMLQVLGATALTEEQARMVHIIQQSGTSLLEILNDILDLSRIEAGHLRLEQQPFVLRDQAVQILEQFHLAAQEKGLYLQVECCEASTQLRSGDPVRMAQILRNLVGNAIKFTHSGGVVVDLCGCEGKKTDDIVVMTISDTGIGMSEEQIKHSVDRFRQADERYNRPFEGTGLGLAIVDSLVTSMGGQTSTTSALGEGTCVTVTLSLPLINETEVEAEAAAKDSTAAQTPPLHLAGNQDAIRVLLVDDNDVNRLVVTSMLATSYFDVTTANDGSSAVELTLTSEFDVILMDIHMPGMDGIEALEQLRAQERAQQRIQTPVLAYTASVTKDEVRRYRELGFQGCVAKPVEAEMLMKALISVLNSSPTTPVT